MSLVPIGFLLASITMSRMLPWRIQLPLLVVLLAAAASAAATITTTVSASSDVDDYNTENSNKEEECRNENNIKNDNRRELPGVSHFGPPQRIPPHLEAFWDGIREYMRTHNNTTTNTIECRNQHSECIVWAAQGECAANPIFMRQSCAPACRSCCFYTDNHDRISTFVDLDALYHRLRRLQHQKTTDDTDTAAVVEWPLVLDHILTPADCDILVTELERDLAMQDNTKISSTTVGARGIATQRQWRTSTTVWCGPECASRARQVLAKLQHLVLDAVNNKNPSMVDNDNDNTTNTMTRWTPNHAEDLQLLKYTAGQEYRLHSDFIPAHEFQPCGVRLLTVLVYLNDIIGTDNEHDNDNGGQTVFPLWKNQIMVQPKMGRVVVWPNAIWNDAEQSWQPHPQCHHQALPVVTNSSSSSSSSKNDDEPNRNVKYAANLWWHERDFQTPFQSGCLS